MNQSQNVFLAVVFIFIASFMVLYYTRGDTDSTVNNLVLVAPQKQQGIVPKLKHAGVILPKAATPPKMISKFIGAHYGFPAHAQNVVTNAKPIICIISLDGSYKVSDLLTYWIACGNTSASFIPPIVHVSGGATNAPNRSFGSTTSNFYGASIENTLDIEIAMTLCPEAEIHVFWGPNTLSGFLGAIQSAVAFCSPLTTRSRTISISWGMDELFYGPQMCATYNAVFKSALDAGISICAASGDNGASDGDGILSLDFPSSSPHVISCGGTTWNGVAGSIESAWSFNSTYKWGGGGGVSFIFPRPAYQNGKANYPSQLTGTALVNNRSSPDVALNANPSTGWAVYFNGSYITVGGTSCVAPAVASFLALCNKNNYNATNNALTRLYSAPSGCFNDVTSGSINDLGFQGLYDARVGFDQCTGLGTIIGSTLISSM